MHILTKEGYERFASEQSQLVKDRALALQDMVRMRELGDLSENAGYRAAKGKLRRIDSRIRFLDKLMRTSKIVDVLKLANDRVGVGAQVTLREDAQVHTYCLVDSVESDLTRNKLSVRSPLGRALLDGVVGKIIKFKTPRGIRILRLESIQY